MLLPNSGARRKGVIRRLGWRLEMEREIAGAAGDHPVRINERRHTDLGDREILSLPNELKLIHQREAEVMFAKLGAIVRRKVGERDAAR